MTIIVRHAIVDAPHDQVWARIVTPEGINDELRPWLTMSMPRGKESLTVDDIPIGTPVDAAGCGCSACCRSTTTT